MSYHIIKSYQETFSSAEVSVPNKLFKFRNFINPKPSELRLRVSVMTASFSVDADTTNDDAETVYFYLTSAPGFHGTVTDSRGASSSMYLLAVTEDSASSRQGIFHGATSYSYMESLPTDTFMIRLQNIDGVIADNCRFSVTFLIELIDESHGKN